MYEFWTNLKSVSKKNETFLMIILTAITLHIIFHAYTSLLDKYYEKEMCDHKHRKL